MQTQEGRVVKKSFSISNLIKKTYNYNFFLNCNLIKKYITTKKRKNEKTVQFSPFSYSIPYFLLILSTQVYIYCQLKQNSPFLNDK